MKLVILLAYLTTSLAIPNAVSNAADVALDKKAIGSSCNYWDSAKYGVSCVVF
jgi:hypothetical protein